MPWRKGSAGKWHSLPEPQLGRTDCVLCTLQAQPETKTDRKRKQLVPVILTSVIVSP